MNGSVFLIIYVIISLLISNFSNSVKHQEILFVFHIANNIANILPKLSGFINFKNFPSVFLMHIFSIFLKISLRFILCIYLIFF